MENISVFDLVVTVLLATATFWGGMRGVVSQISAIATWILSGLAAARYGAVVGDFFSFPEPWRAPVSALIVFCAALLALNVATRFVKRAVSLAGLKEFDRQTGALFGLLKGGAICVVLTFFCVLASEKTRDLVDESKTGPYLASVSLLLKGAFPESETMTRFEELVGTMESTQAKRGETPTLNAEIADLETYLKDNVLSREAADVVEEAESGAETANGGASSGWSRFLNDLRDSIGAKAANNSTATDARNETREAEEERGGWDDWSVWGGRENDEVRGGSTNDGYYDEYEESARSGDWGAYDDGGEEYVETSSDWSDLPSFLTNITGGSRVVEETKGTENALNDFLGTPSSASANVRSETPTFDLSSPRTTDGAIWGRPSATSTPLIPPLPY